LQQPVRVARLGRERVHGGLLAGERRRDARPSGPVDFQTSAHGACDGLQIVLVRTDREVTAAEGSFHHAHVDDVGARGANGDHSGNHRCMLPSGVYLPCSLGEL